MAKQQATLFQVRAAQCLTEMDAFVKDAAKQGIAVPQSLTDAIEAFRESVLPKEDES